MNTRQITIKSWTPREKHTLRGFCTVVLPSGMIIRDVMLHEKGNSRWIQFSAREYTDAQGVKQYARFIEFTDKAIADRFTREVIAALDDYLAQQTQHGAEARP